MRKLRDLAALAGHPQAARIVEGMAHHGDIELPRHRLVNFKEYRWNPFNKNPS